jgi:hypothetical protein
LGCDAGARGIASAVRARDAADPPVPAAGIDTLLWLATNETGARTTGKLYWIGDLDPSTGRR